MTIETRESNEPRAVIAEGAGSVLRLHTRWGADGAIAVEHTWGELLLELPAELRRGDVIKLDPSSKKTSYAEGHAITSYRSSHVSGTVKVVERTDSTTSFEVDLVATEPSIDVDHRGVVPLEGVLEAKRAPRENDCR